MRALSRRPDHTTSRRSVLALVFATVVAVLAGGCTGAPETRSLTDQVADAPVGPDGLLDGKPYDGTTIRFLTCCATVPQFAALDQRTAEFTERTGIRVEWSNIPYAAYLQKIVAESAIGGGTYDALIWPDAWGPSLKIGVQPLDEVMAAHGVTMDDFSGPFREAASAGVENSTYGMPVRGFSYNLFYRKDIYAKLGLEPPTTWAEYYHQLEIIKNGTAEHPVAGQFGRRNGQNLNTWLSMLWSNGGELLDENGAPAFDTPAGIEATEQYLQTIRAGYTPPESSNWGELESTQAFLNGDAATVFTWSWHLEDFVNPTKSAPELAENVGVAPMPAFPGHDEQSYAYTWLAGVLNTSHNQGAAWEYVKWMTNADTERMIALDKSDPATSTGITMHDSNMLDPEVNAANNDLPELQYEALQSGRAIPMSLDWPRIMDVLAVAISNMANGADVRAQLTDAAHRIAELD
ncbi:sugar ABC transporter substrate-binding protein [Nocardia speluncae]|uniref:Sugar ABC transporter substrate-binding protein n=1 Tax=Nocardia speluncae TaxID=419477 RepID=A0A846X8J3_9NOCA|nr:sugar ABC transporter substrate-binding protein [Nocardia speluncae]NKY32541.1 sugar ABC transporter substrate-binding protein [Nocardia speluncae]